MDKVTIGDIATAAGVSAPTLYAQFQSKTGILKAVVERSFFSARYAEIAKQAEKARDPEEILRITASISRIILDTEREEIGLMRGVSALSPELKAIETSWRPYASRSRKRAPRFSSNPSPPRAASASPACATSYGCIPAATSIACSCWSGAGLRTNTNAGSPTR